MVVQKIQPSVPILKEVKLLQVFSDEELGYLLEQGKTMQVEPHANIVIESEPSWGLYLILRGTVGIYKTNKLTGDNFDVGMLREGNFFGEMSLIDQNPRSATVRALTETELFYISGETFNHFMNQSQQLKLKFFESCVNTLVGRLRELDDNYVISQYQLWKIALKKEVA